MNLQRTDSSLLTADLAAAEGWYTKLLGRRPDHRPMPTLLQWELSDEGGLMLSSSEEIAARGAVFLYVDDLAVERRRLDGLGIALGDDNEREYSTLAQVRDPDGNLITLPVHRNGEKIRFAAEGAVVSRIRPKQPPLSSATARRISRSGRPAASLPKPDRGPSPI
jgi:catechol 2,3-dioxygenase-like lactoylglutathione lyase family enzyme